MDRATRRRVLATGASGLALCLSGCSGGDGGNDDEGSSNVVNMTDNLSYEPHSITISTETTVTWENVGNSGHSVTAYEDNIPDDAEYWASGGFDSEQAARDAYPSEGDIAGGESYEQTFSIAGTHEYFCIPHESAGMKGEVVVE